MSAEKGRSTGALTHPELISHVAKACYVLSPALQKVQLATCTSLEDLKEASKDISLTTALNIS